MQSLVLGKRSSEPSETWPRPLLCRVPLCVLNKSLTSPGLRLPVHRCRWGLVTGGVRLEPSQVLGADVGPGGR